MTDITHEALVSRGFKPKLAIWNLELTKHVIKVRRYEVWCVLIIQDEDMVTVPNCRSLADLDNLIKLFV